MKTNDRRVHGSMLAIAALIAATGLAKPVLADDDDPKLRDAKRPVIHVPTHSNIPDEWKLRNHAPTNFGADDVFQSSNIILKTWLPLNSFPGYLPVFPPSGCAETGDVGSGADCWGYTSRAVASTP